MVRNYLIIGDTLYHRGVDSILHHCLTHKEVELVLNYFYSGEGGGHLSRLATSQNILHVGYFWPTIFKDCIEVVNKCHPCKIFSKNMHAHLAPMFPVIIVGPFSKCGLIL
jgi:hypothetical protein